MDALERLRAIIDDAFVATANGETAEGKLGGDGSWRSMVRERVSRCGTRRC